MVESEGEKRRPGEQEGNNGRLWIADSDKGRDELSDRGESEQLAFNSKNQLGERIDTPGAYVGEGGTTTDYDGGGADH